MWSSPCLSIKGDLNLRISQSAFAQITLLLTSCEFSCGSTTSTAKPLLVPAALTIPAAVCGWPNHVAGGSTVGLEGLVVSTKRNLPHLKYWEYHGNYPNWKSCRIIIPFALGELHVHLKKMQPWAWTHASSSSQQYSAQLVQSLYCRMGIGEINPVPLLLICFNLLNSKMSVMRSHHKEKHCWNSAHVLLWRKTPKNKDSKTDIFSFFFFSVNDILDPNPYPVTQLCVNANTQGL